MSKRFSKEPAFGREAKFVVLPVEAVRVHNVRSNDEVIEAQKGITDDMITSLENMVNAAKAGKLEGKSALALGAVAW